MGIYVYSFDDLLRDDIPVPCAMTCFYAGYASIRDDVLAAEADYVRRG